MGYLVAYQGPAEFCKALLPGMVVQQGIRGIARMARACPGNIWFRSTLVG
jgi:hypothetical protein